MQSEKDEKKSISKATKSLVVVEKAATANLSLSRFTHTHRVIVIFILKFPIVVKHRTSNNVLSLFVVVFFFFLTHISLHAHIVVVCVHRTSQIVIVSI